jgi:hypothetical protein
MISSEEGATCTCLWSSEVRERLGVDRMIRSCRRATRQPRRLIGENALNAGKERPGSARD